MRRKRLQHVADTMCQMFCGWRLIGSKPDLVELGSGMLDIDAITGSCYFQGKSISKLGIAEEIQSWMQDDLLANRIPVAALASARLSAKLSFSVVPRSQPEREIFYAEGGAVRTENVNRCVMECVSSVATYEAVYRSQLTEIQEWPIGWPANAINKS